jgi:hypothetical protein
MKGLCPRRLGCEFEEREIDVLASRRNTNACERAQDGGTKLACLHEVRQGFIFMYKLRPVGTSTKAENLLYESRHDSGTILIRKKTKELQ